MLASELIADLERLDEALPVLLASRPSQIEGSSSNEATVTPFGEFLLDDAGRDIDIRPTQNGRGLSVEQVLEALRLQPQAVSYFVNGVESEVLLPDGRTVRSTQPVLGVLATETSVLLLLGSPEMWPTVHFQ
jgi:hypothetical protein